MGRLPSLACTRPVVATRWLPGGIVDGSKQEDVNRDERTWPVKVVVAVVAGPRIDRMEVVGGRSMTIPRSDPGL